MQNHFAQKVEEIMGSAFAGQCLLAVSGGMDSMCMADLFLRCFGAESFAVAHCNFHLRGEESDGDEALVTGWAKEKGVRVHRVDFDTVGYASENGLSIEMAARELRYGWFGDLCREHGYAAVVVAHHADDNAETLVLNMVRGSGLKGLTGMKPLSPLPVPLSFRAASPLSFRASEASREIYLLRPMLTFSRKQIEGHVFAFKVPYREDSTNSSVEYRRNSIRHEVFPLFEKMNPSFVRTFNREMTYFNDAFEIVSDWCRTQAADVVSGRHISIPALMAKPHWRYLLYYILEPYGFNASVLESLEDLLVSGRTLSGKMFESETCMLLTERDRLEIHPKDEACPAIRSEALFMPVRCAGVYNLGSRRFIVEVVDWNSDMPLKQPEGTLIFDAAKLGFPFVCRSWRQGDWLVPLGMRGKKKVSDFFADRKYGHSEKACALMIVDCAPEMAGVQHIAGILGDRIDEHYKVTKDTVSVIRISVADLI